MLGSEISKQSHCILKIKLFCFYTWNYSFEVWNLILRTMFLHTFADPLFAGQETTALLWYATFTFTIANSRLLDATSALTFMLLASSHCSSNFVFYDWNYYSILEFKEAILNHIFNNLKTKSYKFWLLFQIRYTNISLWSFYFL